MTFEMDEFRAVGHRLVDWIADYLNTVEGKALFPDGDPRIIEGLFAEAFPQASQDAEALLRELEEKLYPHLCHVNHPGYFGLITSTPTPMGILGDLLASALNQNVGAYVIGPGAVALERQVVRWLADLVGYGEEAGGHLTSGGTMANFEGLKLARDWTTQNRAQHEGLEGAWAVYMSEERHVSLDKAVDAVGVGRAFLRALPTDADFSVRLDSLEEALAADRAQGIRPLCIVGLAGSTNTGAVDDLVHLRRLADREGCWLHVDAAYGGGMLLSERWPGLLKGIDEADSVTIDPHKWFYAPLDAGALLIKDRSQLTRSFGMRPAYLRDEMDDAGERFDYYAHSFEQSRRFRGLKVWLSFKRYGARQIGGWIDENVAQAQYLFDLVEQHPDFIPAMYPRMSALCVRYHPEGIADERLEKLHAAVVRHVEQNGNFWITTTKLKGKTWFRINPVNLRTRRVHMEQLLEEVDRECRAVLRATN